MIDIIINLPCSCLITKLQDNTESNLLGRKTTFETDKMALIVSYVVDIGAYTKLVAQPLAIGK